MRLIIRIIDRLISSGNCVFLAYISNIYYCNKLIEDVALTSMLLVFSFDKDVVNICFSLAQDIKLSLLKKIALCVSIIIKLLVYLNYSFEDGVLILYIIILVDFASDFIFDKRKKETKENELKI